MAKTYRKAIDIPDDVAFAAFGVLPPHAFIKAEKFYPMKVFKNAPQWGKGVCLVPALHKIVDASDGSSVHQKSLTKQLSAYSDEHAMALDDVSKEHIVLAIRALLCQMLNHKGNKRTIPMAYHQKYSCLWDKLKVEATCSSTTITSATSDVEIAEPSQPDVETISIDSQSEEIDKDDLFSSDNPILKAILQDDGQSASENQTRRRIHGKQSIGTSPNLSEANMNVTGFDMTQLTATDPVEISPHSFRQLNASLKDKTRKRKKGKGDKEKVKAKPPKKKVSKKTKKKVSSDNPEDAFRAFIKREHWKAWFAAKSKAAQNGKSKEEIKAAGSEAGLARVAFLRKSKADGLIDAFGVDIK